MNKDTTGDDKTVSKPNEGDKNELNRKVNELQRKNKKMNEKLNFYRRLERERQKKNKVQKFISSLFNILKNK